MEANVTSIVGQAEPNVIMSIAIAIGIFLIGLVVGRILGKLTETLLDWVGLEQVAKMKSFSLHRVLSSTVAVITYIIFGLIALNYLGVGSLVLTVLGGIAIIVILASTFLSLRDSLPNIVAYRKIANKVKKDYVVSIDSVSGTVQSVTMLEVEVLTKQGDIIHIPNRLFMNAKYSVKKSSTKK